VKRRVDLIASVRGILKSLGLTLKLSNTNYFVAHSRKALEGEQEVALNLIEPMLISIETMTEQIKCLDREIEELANSRYPETHYATKFKKS